MHPTTLITGAGKRIGAAIATHLARGGHNLLLHYNRSKVEAEALATTLRALPQSPQVTLLQADLSDLASLAYFWRDLPPVTHLIHNASHYGRDTLADFSLAQLRTHMAVNLEAPLLLSQGFMAQLPEGVNGTITLLGDGAMGWSISPQFFTYALSKHALASVIDVLAAAVAPRARANVIALGPTLPGTMDDPDMFTRLAARAPLQRTDEVSEILVALDFLLASPGVTGQVLSLANGMGLTTARPS